MEQISLGVVVTFSSSIQTIHSLQDSVHPVIISCPWHLKTVVDVAHHISYTQTLNQSINHSSFAYHMITPLTWIEIVIWFVVSCMKLWLQSNPMQSTPNHTSPMKGKQMPSVLKLQIVRLYPLWFFQIDQGCRATHPDQEYSGRAGASLRKLNRP